MTDENDDLNTDPNATDLDDANDTGDETPPENDGETSTTDENGQQGEGGTDEEAAFLAGFDGKEESTPEQVEPAKQAAAESGEGENATLTPQQLQEIFARVPGLEAKFNEELAKVHGKFGDMNRTLQALKERHEAAGTVQISADTLKNLGGEYEDVAELLAKDLAELLPKMGGGQAGGLDEETVNRMLAERDLRNERRMLTMQHPDWQTVAGSKGFIDWIGTLDPAQRDAYVNSDDALVASECFTKYKSYQRSQTRNTQRNQNRLRRAAAPAGTGGADAGKTLVDDNAAFEYGFKTAKG